MIDHDPINWVHIGGTNVQMVLTLAEKTQGQLAANGKMRDKAQTRL